MKFAKDLMSDRETQSNKVGTFATRSSRNAWAESIEPLVRDLAPYPISYDVCNHSPHLTSINFSEYTYTEFLGGVWIGTQSGEINCRMMVQASLDTHPMLSNDTIHQIIGDKYTLSSDLGKWKNVRKVMFVPGHNLLGITSHEVMSRLIFEQDDIYIKPHPITNQDTLNLMGKKFGWNKIIDKDLSGNALLAQCDEIYTTSASEMSITGTLLGKPVYNITNFLMEGYGAYFPISRLVFSARQQIEQAQRALHNIFSCPWSGVILPSHNNVEERIRSFYAKSLEFRDLYKPLTPPWHPKNSKPVNTTS